MRLVGPVVLSVGVLWAACGGGAAPGAPGDGAAAAPDGTGAVVVQSPDLRFKWVGAGFPLHIGPITDAGTALMGAFSQRGPVGVAPLALSGEVASTYQLFSGPADLETMIAVGLSGALPGIDADLLPQVTSRSIVVSLDSSPLDLQGSASSGGIYNAVLSGSEGGVDYLPLSRATLAVADLSAWATSQAALGRVVTALCPKDGGLYATAFGRAGDTSAYEAQVVTAPLDQLVSQLESLAASGYVVTALGRDGQGIDGAGGFVAVGTRPAGQTTPRTIQSVDVPCVAGVGDPRAALQPLLEDGFALVGFVFHNASGDCTGAPTWLFIVER
jgi:hypothetical protein